MRRSLDILIDNLNHLLADRSSYWLAKESGVSEGNISKIRSKKASPNLDTIDSIARALRVSPSDLLSEIKKTSIPSDIINQLEGQSEAVFEAIRGMLRAIAKERKKV